MPLDDVSTNLRRHNSIADSGHSLSKKTVSTKSVPTGVPLAVQSMLKSTTELGNIDLLPFQVSSLPRSASRCTTRSQQTGSLSATSPFHRGQPDIPTKKPYCIHEPGTNSSVSVLSRPESTTSTLQSQQCYPLSRHRRAYDKPFSMPKIPQAFPGSKELHSHHSLTMLKGGRSNSQLNSSSFNMKFAGRGTASFRKKSPYIKGSHSHVQGPVQTIFPRTTSIRTSASSQVSAISASKLILPGWRSGFSRYDSLMNRPSPPVYFSERDWQHARKIAGTKTARISETQQSRFGSPASLNRMPTTPERSDTPFYYDYSESFIEAPYVSKAGIYNYTPLRSTGKPAIVNEEVHIMKRAQTPFGTLPGSSFKPVELATTHNQTPNKQTSTSTSQPDRHQQLHSQAYEDCLRPVSTKSTSPAHTPQLGKAHAANAETELLSQCDASGDGPVEPSKLSVLESVAHDDSNELPCTISPRYRTSTSSSIIFSSASRNPRNLTKLAACAHSPSERKGSPERQALGSLVRSLDAEDKIPHVSCTSEQECFESKLPDLSFRPLSIGVDSAHYRPRTSPAPKPGQQLDVLSPQPQRPMSSQSRKKFSKILDLKCDSANNGPFALEKETRTSGGTMLERVEEHSEMEEQLMLPASYVFDIAEEDVHRNDTPRFSGITSHDRSTIESLLDRHIECLGLVPQTILSTEDDLVQAIKVDDSATDLGKKQLSSSNSLPQPQKGNLLVRASYSCGPTSLASIDRQKLMPKRLFANIDPKFPSFPFATSESDLADTTFFESDASRPSYGWQTLASDGEAQTQLGDSKSSLLSGELADIDTEPKIKRFTVRRKSETPLSNGSFERECLTSGKGATSFVNGLPRRRSRRDVLARKASHRRRKVKVHLKARRTQPTDRTTLSLAENPSMSQHARPNPTFTPSINGFAELSADPATGRFTFPRRQTSVLHSTPNRWSNIVAAMPLPKKRNSKVSRKLSLRSKHSNKSNASIVEPVNNSRLTTDARGQSIDKVPRLPPRLAEPDFGPPLSSSELRLSVPYPEIPSFVPASAGGSMRVSETSPYKSSTVSNRKPWKLSSLRNIFAVESPKNTMTPAGRPASENTNTGTGLSCRFKPGYSTTDRIISSETVPMSDFSFRRRKVLEKFKSWWKRQCMQKTFVIRKRTSKVDGILV